MVKVFDRVEWDFLEKVMGKLGFHEKWVKWVMECVSTVAYSINVNGKNAGDVKPRRGIRQGDPMSPYLFLLVADVLSLLIASAVREGRLKRIKMKRSCPSVSHLLFADDSIFFLRAKRRYAMELKVVLEQYC